MQTITILTGAGISAESGLGTFRSKDGIWAKYDLTKVATPEAFARDPEMVHEFYNLRREACAKAAPNAAHVALARLQREWPGEVVIVTQNVDDLHERAGASVLHMHGELMRARCSDCDHRWPAPAVMQISDPCPACGAAKARPDVVWFGEYPYFDDEISLAVRRSDLFAVIGSSGQVYPAAGYAGIAKRARIRTIEFNLKRTGGKFDQGRYGPATETVPFWVDEILRLPKE
ncbi:NAD-dependent deacylase [Falsirhodobacter xinxiangensis]|uniref:NAD-dependent deacylase n=1 Tax=Falsirhodobacter xinxiangensis TaxID=2530049 RepID=UPI0010AACBBF|nr:NAD-dependent deacylase [Rhodobacter xinxiangensis]